jgi:hypothetical protein
MPNGWLESRSFPHGKQFGRYEVILPFFCGDCFIVGRGLNERETVGYKIDIFPQFLLVPIN